MKGLLMEEHLYHKTTEGIKTETRRLGSLSKLPENLCLVNGIMGRFYPTFNGAVEDTKGNRYKPRFTKGDIVFIKEPTCEFANGEIHYRYRGDEGFENIWGNKMFMPESKARLKIEIINVFAQRLKQISPDSAISEGLETMIGNNTGHLFFKNYMVEDTWEDNPIVSYATLWESINGKKSWDIDPFVWVYQYRLFYFLS